MRPRLTSFCFGVVAGAAGVGILLLIPTSTNKRVSGNSTIAAETTPAAGDARTGSTQSFDWRVVESEDYRKYIANLRFVGCPEETIRDIITADVNKLFEERRKSLTGEKTHRFEYWKSWEQRSQRAYDEDKIKAQQNLANERRAVLKALLGVEPVEKLEVLPPGLPEDIYDFLDPARRWEVVAIEQRFTARRIKSAMTGTSMSSLNKIEKECEAEIAKLLSPEELEEYKLRRSSTAMRLTSELESFEPSEQEFREIYKLRSQIEDELGVSATGTLTSEATAKLDEGIKDLLGPARYANYEHSQEYDYKTIYELAARNGFGKDAADRVYDLKKAVGDQVKAVRTDSSLTPEQRTATLLRIRRETEQAVRTVFDGDAFQTFHSKTGNWLNNISPDSP